MASRTHPDFLIDLTETPSNSIFVYDSWLSECREYLSKNNYSTTPTTEFEQWLLHDLTVTSPGCLPRDLNYKETVLNDTYALQINFIWSLKSLSPFRSVFYDIIEKVKPKMRADLHDLDRGLLLVMTDGVQNLLGLVLKRIKYLCVNTVPGCKVLVKGPLVTSKFYDSSLIILSNDNCKLLGGEVETLMKHSYKHTENQCNFQPQVLDLPKGCPSISNFIPQNSEGGAARTGKRCNSNINMTVNKRIKTEPAGNNYLVYSSNQISQQIVISDDEEVVEKERTVQYLLPPGSLILKRPQ